MRARNFLISLGIFVVSLFIFSLPSFGSMVCISQFNHKSVADGLVRGDIIRIEQGDQILQHITLGDRVLNPGTYMVLEFNKAIIRHNEDSYDPRFEFRDPRVVGFQESLIPLPIKTIENSDTTLVLAPVNRHDNRIHSYQSGIRIPRSDIYEFKMKGLANFVPVRVEGKSIARVSKGFNSSHGFFEVLSPMKLKELQEGDFIIYKGELKLVFGVERSELNPVDLDGTTILLTIPKLLLMDVDVNFRGGMAGIKLGSAKKEYIKGDSPIFIVKRTGQSPGSLAPVRGVRLFDLLELRFDLLELSEWMFEKAISMSKGEPLDPYYVSREFEVIKDYGQ